jgi:hypothetical protein
LILRGSVPGGSNGMVIVKNANKRRGAVRISMEGEEQTKKKAAAGKKPAAKKK